MAKRPPLFPNASYPDGKINHLEALVRECYAALRNAESGLTDKRESIKAMGLRSVIATMKLIDRAALGDTTQEDKP